MNEPSVIGPPVHSNLPFQFVLLLLSARRPMALPIAPLTFDRAILDTFASVAPFELSVRLPTASTFAFRAW